MKKVSSHHLLENFEVYRPLIQISKADILKYLKKNNLDYFVDPTNFDEKTSLRNYIRNQIIFPAQKQNKNFLTSWQQDYETLEQIKTKYFDFIELKLPKIFEDKNIKIYKYNFPETIFETYILMAQL